MRWLWASSFFQVSRKPFLEAAGLLVAFLTFAGHAAEGVPRVELVDSVECWVSPGWGNNTPKIVQNDQGDVWVVGLSGSYEKSLASIYKRAGSGEWIKSAFQPATYQPAMMLLDEKQHLNVFTNSQTGPIRQYRSKNETNPDDFELIASGNGQSDPRGWYVGVGISDGIIYMAYVTLNYDFWLTWKAVLDSVWAPPVKLYSGLVSPDGNHALLYPQFYFGKTAGYIMSSHTSDGSTHNFKDKVYLTSFSKDDPARFSNEVIYECGRGYGNMGFGFVTDEHSLYCAFAGGVHHYGPINDQALVEGNYLAVRNKGETNWSIQKIGTEKGMVAVSLIPSGRMFAVVSDREASGSVRCSIKYSDDRGQSWENHTFDPMMHSSRDLLSYPNYFQFIGRQSGSKSDGLHLFFTNDDYSRKTDQGLYRYNIFYMRIM